MNNFSIKTITYSNGITEYIPYIQVLNKKNKLTSVKLAKVVINKYYGKYPKFYTWEDAQAFINKHDNVAVRIEICEYGAVSESFYHQDKEKDQLTSQHEDKDLNIKVRPNISEEHVDIIKLIKEELEKGTESELLKSFNLGTERSKNIHNVDVKKGLRDMFNGEVTEESTKLSSKINELYAKLVEITTVKNGRSIKDNFVKKYEDKEEAKVNIEYNPINTGVDFGNSYDKSLLKYVEKIQPSEEFKVKEALIEEKILRKESDINIIRSILPSHYIITDVVDGVRCVSEEGIDELYWDDNTILDFKTQFEDRIDKIHFNTYNNKLDFIVYLKD